MIFEEYDDLSEVICQVEYGENVIFLQEKNNTIRFTSSKPMTLKKFSDFSDASEFMLTSGVPVGITAINAYMQNKKITAKLFAKSQLERKLYGKIADDLKATNKYKVSKKYTRGGVLYKLVRI